MQYQNRTAGAQSTVPGIDADYLGALFDESCRPLPTNEKPAYCRICQHPLNSYNRTGICEHGHRDELETRVIRYGRRPTHHGKPCRKCGATERYPAGNCVFCAKQKAKAQADAKRRARKSGFSDPKIRNTNPKIRNRESQ
jgi:hypothetical protein